MISNLSIRLQNFKSYLDSGWVSLEGRNVLVGVDTRGYSNGSGKSSILDALGLFLDNSYVEYTKSEVTTLTNINAKKKQHIIIDLKCDIDGDLFEGSISGVDGFIFTGDKYKLSKFQQAMSGSIMSQGLLNNLADFEKRSQLDEYIDQFYKAKEVITKLKDFQKETSSHFNKRITEITNKINFEEEKLNSIKEQHFAVVGQSSSFHEYSLENIEELKSENLTLANEVQKSYEDFRVKRLNLESKKTQIVYELGSLGNVQVLQDKLDRVKNNKISYKVDCQVNYLQNVRLIAQEYVANYTKGIKRDYLAMYNEEVQRLTKEYSDKVNQIKAEIIKLSSKGPDYELTVEEINELNNAVKDWTPEFNLGDTYKQVTDSIKWFSTNVKEVVEKDSKEVQELRLTLESLPNEIIDKPEIVKNAEQLYIDCNNSNYAPQNKVGYYVYYRWLGEEENTFTFESNLPTEFNSKLDLEDLLSKLPKFTYNTSSFDKEIQSLEAELGKDYSEHIKSLNNQLKEIDDELRSLSERELNYEKILNTKESIDRRIVGYENFIFTSNKIKETGMAMVTIEENVNSLKSEKARFTKRQEDLNKLVDSIGKFSGEELRNEFGFKLAKLSSVLLNDIFNLNGELILESNNIRTTFKYNDGNGFLGFKVLSGGQLQKIKLSINLALLLFFHKDRQYIFLDEVFQHLDNSSKALLINYIVSELGVKNILLIQHDSLKFEGFKEIRVYRDENKNTKVVA